ncbi:hypothetical protein ACLB6G_18425 [Zhengella sp. ZM62]|uniref:hypothetical protein n=1 Tax=Zhengella sedimenti TaxID=3390035 RepID=UPI0039754904
MRDKRKDMRRLVHLAGQMENLNMARSTHLSGKLRAVEDDLRSLDVFAAEPSLAMDLFPDLVVRKQSELKAEKARLTGERDAVERERMRRERQKERLGERLTAIEGEASAASQEESGSDWAARANRAGTSFRQV